MSGPPSTGRIARSLRRAAGTIALLTALMGATILLPALVGTTTSSAQHAARHLAARSFAKPSVSVDALNSPPPTATDTTGTTAYSPPSLYVSGASFTPGDPLHVQLIASDGPNAGSVLAEEDITATQDAYLTQADGQEVLVPGGQFGIKLTPSLASELLCQAMTHAAVTAVDTATGESASSYSIDISRWGCVAYTETPTPTASWTPTATPTGGSQ